MKTTDCARAAEMLLEARARRRWLDALPDGAQPASETEAYAIQDMVARRLGPIVGWKVGSATLYSEPFRAPIHEATLRIEDPRLPADLFHVIGVEAEIVYRFARDPLCPGRGSGRRRLDASRRGNGRHTLFRVRFCRCSQSEGRSAEPWRPVRGTSLTELVPGRSGPATGAADDQWDVPLQR